MGEGAWRTPDAFHRTVPIRDALASAGSRVPGGRIPDRMARPRTLPWRRIVIAVASGVVALEFALQIGSLAIAMRTSSTPVDGAEVLCIGDSFTAGIGATTPGHSYPSALERHLSRHIPGIRVSNLGMPGQDSAYMLARLRGNVHARTKVVVAMMAYNDTWSQPARITELGSTGVSASGWTLRWRTGRLLALATRFGANSWFDGIAGGQPRHEGDLKDRDAGFAMLDGLGLTDPGSPMPVLSPRPEPEARSLLERCEHALRVGDMALALAAARESTARFPACMAAHRLLAIVMHKRGESSKRDEALGLLAERAAAGDLAAAEEHMIALLAIGEAGTAASIAKARMRDAERELVSAVVLQEALFGLGEMDEFARIAPITLRLCNRLLPDLSATIARHMAEASGADNPGRSARLLVAAGLIDGNVALARAKASACRASIPWQDFEGAIAEAAARTPVAAKEWLRLLRDFHETGAEDTQWATTLEEHIVLLGDHCRSLGVRCVVVGYPFRHDGLEAAQRRAATRIGAPFVDANDAFARTIGDGDGAELFVANGHCNDSGYELLAKLVAEIVSEQVK